MSSLLTHGAAFAGIGGANVKCRRCGGTGEEPDWRAVGAKLRADREQAGLTQTEVAFRLGMSKAYVSDLERGARPWRTELVERYREALT